MSARPSMSNVTRGWVATTDNLVDVGLPQGQCLVVKSSRTGASRRFVVGALPCRIIRHPMEGRNMPRKPLLVAVLSTLLCLVGVGPTAASDHPGSGSRHGPPTNGPIAFGRVDLAIGGPSLWTSNADGSHQVRLTTDVTGFSDWSPDGRRIAFDFADDSGVHIATISPDGRHRRSLTTTLGVQEVPRWSPDGTKIAFGRIVGDSPTGQLEAIYVIHADGSGLREVVPARAGLEHPDWSPDGRQITFNIAPENPDAADSGAILSVRPNGRGLRVMYPPTRELRFFKAVWSPDGREILSGCHDTRVGLDRICRISGRGKTRVVVSGDTDVNFPSWGAQARPRH